MSLLRKYFPEILVVLGLLIHPLNVGAQQCPGTTVKTASKSVIKYTAGGTGPAHAFIGAGCSTAKFGTMLPTVCNAFATSMFAGAYAIFSNAVSNNTMNGCSFMCPGGTCIVRGGDALPVELMEFSVSQTQSPAATEGK